MAEASVRYEPSGVNDSARGTRIPEVSEKKR
jgi:hypothetical protein